jgi:sulfate permease, SulP family
LIKNSLSRSSFRDRLCLLFRDGMVAAFVSMILLILSISSGALIFSGPLGDHLLPGVGLVLVSVLITSLALSIKSSFPQAIASPQDTFVIILAISGASIAHQLHDKGADDQIFPTVVTAILISSTTIGFLLFLMGQFELGKYARFIPHQVLGGFFAGTGMLIMEHSLVVSTGEEFHFHHYQDFLSVHMMELWIPAIILGVVLFFAWRFFWQPLILPPIVIVSAIIFYFVLYFNGVSLDGALNRGLCLGPFTEGAMWNLPSLSFIQQTNWGVLNSEFGNFLSIIVLTPIALFLNATVIEAETKGDMKLNNEVKYVGIANLVAPVLGGGVFADHGMLESVLNHKLGARSRIAGVIVLTLFVFVLIYSHSLIALIPRFLIGGVVLYVGLDLAATWLFDSRHSYSVLEYCVILIIAAVILVEGFIQGLTLGLIVSFFVFIFNYSKMQVVKNYFLGSYMHSNVERGKLGREAILKYGDGIHIVHLQGYLFFGNSQNFYEKVVGCIRDQENCEVKYVAIDFKSVEGLDSSSMYSFIKLYHFSQKNNITLLLCDLSESLKNILSKQLPLDGDDGTLRLFSTLDYALEWCENRLLEKEEVKKTGELSRVEELEQLIETIVSSGNFPRYFEKMSVEKDFVLFEQGSEALDLYFLETGFVDVMLNVKDGKPIRLRSIGPGTVVGELGLYLDTPRSASIVATQPCTLFRLTKEGIERMKEEDPQVVIWFQEMIITQLASRLLYSNQQINGLLQSSYCDNK